MPSTKMMGLLLAASSATAIYLVKPNSMAQSRQMLPFSPTLSGYFPTKESLMNKVTSAVNYVVNKSAVSVFDCNSIQKEWLKWLEVAFSHKQVYDQLLRLLLDGIVDPKFLEHATVYGLDLVSHAVQQPAVLEASKDMVVDVLVNEPRVVNESVELCKWFVYD